MSAIVLSTVPGATIKAIIAALFMVNVVLTNTVSKKEIVLGLSKVFSNTLTVLAILIIYARPTAISTIKITVLIVGQVMAKAISHQGICDSHICSTFLATAFRAIFFVHAWSAAVSSVKFTMQVVGVVVTVSVSNKSSQLAL